MNIIFLDVDGVLNNWKDAEERYKKTRRPCIGFEWPFSKQSMEILRDLVNRTDSKIVVTSSWRLFEEGREILLEELEKYSIKDKVIGEVPNLQSSNREEEIIDYLTTLNKNVNFVILDDENYYQELEKFFVDIDNYLGLQEHHASKAIELFELQEKGKL